MTAALSKHNCIAHRLLTFAKEPNRTLDVFIGKPFLVDEHEWHCPYRIVGDDYDFSSAIIGVDSVQTLQLIWRVIDGIIEGDELELLWFDEPFMGFWQYN
ncbi:MAG: hypothetical protein Q4B81_00805 [Moraxella sp.]|nr:hypothetical protein [Moraxella sp.]